MIKEYLIPPNLAALGLQRRTDIGVADIMTIWKTPYPVITRYNMLCKELEWQPFGGGTMRQQGARVPGFITSGYRSLPVDDNMTSPHMHAFALDFIVGDVAEQVRVARVAVKYFCRVGLYPTSGFIHVDLAPDNWIEKYNKARFWVKRKAKVSLFSDLVDATDDALKH